MKNEVVFDSEFKKKSKVNLERVLRDFPLEVASGEGKCIFPSIRVVKDRRYNNSFNRYILKAESDIIKVKMPASTQVNEDRDGLYFLLDSQSRKSAYRSSIEGMTRDNLEYN